MSYKAPNAYKGFEIRLQAVKMNAKMIIVSTLVTLVVYLAACGLFMWLSVGEIMSVIMGYAWDAVRAVSLPGLSRAWTAMAHVIDYCTLYFFLALPVLLIFPLLINIWRRACKNETADQHLRGTALVEPAQLNRALKADGLAAPDDIMMGSCHLPRQFETQHTFIGGRAGSGKTTLKCQMLDTVRKRGGKAIVHDMKADYVPVYYNPEIDLILNPLDIRHVQWSPLAEIESLQDCESMAHSLIQPKEHDFWSSAARDIFFSICFYSVMKNKKSNRDLWDLLAKSEGELLDVMTAAVAGGMDECRKALAYLEGDKKGSKVAADTIATMRQFTNSFLYLRDSDGSWRLRDWIADGKPGILFIVNYASLSATLRPIMSLALDMACRYVLSLAESYERRIYFFIDEFPQLQRLPSLLNLLAAGRSKGASVILAAQDIGQITDLYGREKMGSLVNNCNTTISFQLGDPQSQDYMSLLYGDREILETDESISMGPENTRDGLQLSRRRRKERLILPSEFATLPKLNFYLKMLHHNVARDTLIRRERPARHPAMIEKNIYNIKGRQGQISEAKEEAATKPIDL